MTSSKLQGFAQNRAEKALVLTHNCGVEPAINWIMDHEQVHSGEHSKGIALNTCLFCFTGAKT